MLMADVKENQGKVAMKGKEFAGKYYKIFDETTPDERIQKLADLYVDEGSIIYWNGHSSESAGGAHKLLRLVLALMPPTRHHIASVDAQALPRCEDADFFILTITGRCTYNQEVARSFFHTLVVRQHQDKHYILEDDFRWLAER